MADHKSYQKSEYVCVDAEGATHAKSDTQNHDGNLWYPAATKAGSIDEELYPDAAEVGCSVCLAPRATYVKWGGNSCNEGSTTLYKGIAGGSGYKTQGSGYNSICLHSQPQRNPGWRSHGDGGAIIVGTEYHSSKSSATIDKNTYHDAACAVCQVTSTEPGSVLVQWGRSESCSNGHETLYTGIVHANYHTGGHTRAEYVCVGKERDSHQANNPEYDENSQRWYTAATEISALAGSQYAMYGEIGCAVCFAPTPTYVRWGGNDCAEGSTVQYNGYVAGAHYGHSGDGANALCLHPKPEHPAGRSLAANWESIVYGTEYEVGANFDKDAGCVVCSIDGGDETAFQGGAVYTAWGRSVDCTSGHTTLYTGTVVSDYHKHAYRSLYMCVDGEHATHPTSSEINRNGKLW